MSSTVITTTLSILTSRTTKQPRTYEVEEQEPLGVSIGIFLGILFGSLIFIFFVIGLMILGHTFYMKVLKRPFSEAKSKSVWFIEPQIKEEKKSNIKHEKLSEIDSNSRRSSISVGSTIRVDPIVNAIVKFEEKQTNDTNVYYASKSENDNLAYVESAPELRQIKNTPNLHHVKNYPSSYLRITEV